MTGKTITQAPHTGASDDRPSWLDLALCAQTGAAFFFPEPGSSVREAKQICQACEGRAACLEYALANDERFGVWGGLSEKERDRLRRGPARRPADRA
ncbi:WhiB family transcriptional regulator [Streptomyces sp. B-S-A8]|uniref:Transcriptional regulator WhiB n=1 Tax=Streptomyces solicavernae TaxID=3043614 RepID=A0ABT6RLT5_9ACTN|nr:WhiB family transcriptional regulator [Streptomyces sp. B-S-A8]MDI3385392.1 WhiB family transcriptional regulator [Streptomyces sp. B-S-A8]